MRRSNHSKRIIIAVVCFSIFALLLLLSELSATIYDGRVTVSVKLPAELQTHLSEFRYDPFHSTPVSAMSVEDIKLFTHIAKLDGDHFDCELPTSYAIRRGLWPRKIDTLPAERPFSVWLLFDDGQRREIQSPRPDASGSRLVVLETPANEAGK